MQYRINASVPETTEVFTPGRYVKVVKKYGAMDTRKSETLFTGKVVSVNVEFEKTTYCIQRDISGCILTANVPSHDSSKFPDFVLVVELVTDSDLW